MCVCYSRFYWQEYPLKRCRPLQCIPIIVGNYLLTAPIIAVSILPPKRTPSEAKESLFWVQAATPRNCLATESVLEICLRNLGPARLLVCMKGIRLRGRLNGTKSGTRQNRRRILTSAIRQTDNEMLNRDNLWWFRGTDFSDFHQLSLLVHMNQTVEYICLHTTRKIFKKIIVFKAWNAWY